VREALSSNGLEIAVITSILVDKGIITQEEYAEKRVQVSKEIIEYVQEKIKEESKEPKVTIQ
jgi:predicted transporter